MPVGNSTPTGFAVSSANAVPTFFDCFGIHWRGPLVLAGRQRRQAFAAGGRGV